MGFGVGILSGLLGVGGGVVLVPAMVYLLGMNQHRAHGTSLAVISLVVLFSAIFYSRHGQVNWVVAGELMVGGVIGASIGARIANLLTGRRLRRYFGLFLVIIAVRMLYDAIAMLANGGGPAWAGYSISPTLVSGALLIAAIGVLTGTLSGLLGVGGGIIMIPAMVLLLGFSQKLAQGISLAVIIPVSISGALIHSRHGNVRADIGAWLALGGIVGGLVGARIAVGLSPHVLRGAFGVLQLAVGMLTLFRGRPQGQASEPTQSDAGIGLGG